jgi:hypothetical protein
MTEPLDRWQQLVYWTYQAATYITLTVIDDAAMLAFAFS